MYETSLLGKVNAGHLTCKDDLRFLVAFKRAYIMRTVPANRKAYTGLCLISQGMKCQVHLGCYLRPNTSLSRGAFLAYRYTMQELPSGILVLVVFLQRTGHARLDRVPRSPPFSAGSRRLFRTL